MAAYARQAMPRWCLGAVALPPLLWPATLLRGRAFSSASRVRRLGKGASVEISPETSEKSVAMLEERLPPESFVFVNMVKTTAGEAEHFVAVAKASAALRTRGLRPVPHVPVSRIETKQSFGEVVRSLVQAGARDLLLVGGNDLQQRQKELPYGNVSELLEGEMDTLTSHGIESVVLAGLPDSPTWKGWNEEVAQKVLLEKARLILAAGLRAEVATQFCFDPRQLLRWLRRTDQALKDLRSAVGGAGSVGLRVGVPGPTSLQRLRRIAGICKVPDHYLQPSMFDLALQGDRVSVDELEERYEVLGFGHTERSSTREARRQLFSDCASEGSLGRAELGEALWRDVQAELVSAAGASRGGAASGPSACVLEEVDESEQIICEDVLWSLAAAELQLEVNLYPFGGLASSLELAEDLRRGAVPRRAR